MMRTIELLEDEIVLVDVAAKYYAERKSIKGTLTLTNKRLIFKGKMLKSFYIPLDSIVNVSKLKQKFWFPSMLNVQQKAGEFNFSVDYIDDWVYILNGKNSK